MARPTEEDERRILDEQEAQGRSLARAPEVEKAAERIRVSRAAARLVDQEEAARGFTVPPSRLTLAEELDMPYPPLTYTVDQLHPVGANTLLGAKFKAGKTTMLANLLRALVDGESFLGEHPTKRSPGRVAFWNYEVTGHQFQRWLRDAGIVNTDEAAVWNLRGHRMPLSVPHVEDVVVGWLKEREVGTLIVDPYSRAYTGEENNNTEVGRFLETLDVIKERAGVTDLFISAHFGRGGQDEGAERVRGATRLDDWADVRWILTTDDEGQRFFKADGRDVYVPERRLGFEESTRRLSVVGGSRSSERKQKQQVEVMKKVVSACDENPGINTEELRKKVTGVGTEVKVAAIRGALNGKWIRQEKVGKAMCHYATDRGRQAAGPGQRLGGEGGSASEQAGTA